MPLDFFDVERGIRLDDTGVHFIVLDANPDDGVGDSDIVGKGSMGIVVTDDSSTWWKKIANGAGADKWTQCCRTIAPGDEAQIDIDSWREPAWTIDETTTAYADAITTLNETNALGGAVMSPGDRVVMAVLADDGLNNIYSAEKAPAELTFGVGGTDSIQLEAKNRGPEGDTISIVYTTNTFDDDPNTTATLTNTPGVQSSALIGTNLTDELIVTALESGTIGDAYTIVYTDNGLDSASVTTATISGTDITVNLANNGAAITATLNSVVAAINDVGGPVSKEVEADVNTGSLGTNVIGSAYTVQNFGSGADEDNLITIHLGNSYDTLTSTGTILATTEDVKTAIDATDGPTDLVLVTVVDSGVIDSEYVEANLTGGSIGPAQVSYAQIGVPGSDQVNITSADIDNSRTIEYTTNSFDEAALTTAINVAGVITVNLANERVGATLSTGTSTVDEIDYAAVLAGVEGNDITIEYTTNSLDGAGTTTVGVVGDVITVNLANNGAAITATVQQIVNAINGSGAAAALVTASIGAGTTGTTALVAESGPTNLTGGESNILATADDVVAALVDVAEVSGSLGLGVAGATVITAEHTTVTIDGGTIGNWTLLEDQYNQETDGDTVWIDEGLGGGRIYTLEDGVWVQRGAADRTEINYIRQFIGKDFAGNELPEYITNNFITDGDTLELAIGKLDQEIGPNVTGGTYIEAGDTINTNIQSLNDAIENIKYVTRTDIPASTPTIVNGDDTLGCVVQKYFVHVRDMSSGNQGHLYIGTNANEELYVQANFVGSDYNNVDVVYTTNGFDGAATTTTSVDGVIGDDSPVVITVSLANDGATAISATAQDVIDAINLIASDSAALVTASLAAGSTAGTTIMSEYAAVDIVEGDDEQGRVNAAEIYVTHNRQVGADGKMSETEVADRADYTVYAKLRIEQTIQGLTYDVTLTGVGVDQQVNLVVEADVDVMVTAARALVEYLDEPTL